MESRGDLVIRVIERALDSPDLQVTFSETTRYSFFRLEWSDNFAVIKLMTVFFGLMHDYEVSLHIHGGKIPDFILERTPSGRLTHVVKRLRMIVAANEADIEKKKTEQLRKLV